MLLPCSHFNKLQFAHFHTIFTETNPHVSQCQLRSMSVYRPQQGKQAASQAEYGTPENRPIFPLKRDPYTKPLF